MILWYMWNSISQNHIMGQVGRHHSVSSAPRARGTGLHPDGSRISPVRETLKHHWAICSSALSPMFKNSKSFLVLQPKKDINVSWTTVITLDILGNDGGFPCFALPTFSPALLGQRGCPCRLIPLGK